jgi:hypothetical protein
MKRKNQDAINQKLVDDKQFCERYFTRAIGTPIRIEKVANVISFFTLAPSQKVAEVTEQELLASTDPAGLVKGKISKTLVR